MVTCRTSQSAINQVENGRSKRSWSTSEESAIRSKVKANNRRLELAKKQGATDLEARNLAELQKAERAIGEAESVGVELLQLHPKEFSKQENYLARTLGIHKKALGLDDVMTQAGQVKLQIADMIQSAENLVNVTARYARKKTTNDALSDIYTLLKQKGLHNTDGIDEFINNVVEVAKSPRQRVSFGNTDAVNLVLTKRHNDMMAEANKLGLGPDDMDVIVGRLTTAMKATDDTYALAKVLGADMGSVENIGYVMRSFTDKAQAYFKMKDVDISSWGTRAPGTSSVQRSRESWSLIPEDYQVLAQYLRPGKYKEWNDTVSDMIGDAVNSHIKKVLGNYNVNSKVYKQVLREEAVVDRLTDTLGKAVNAKKPNTARIDLVRLKLYDAESNLAATMKTFSQSNTASTFEDLVELFPTYAKQYDIKRVAGRKAFMDKVVNNPTDYVTTLKNYNGDEEAVVQFLSRLTGKSTDELDKLRYADLDKTVLDLHEMADDGQALTTYLHKNLSSTQLDDLVDSGVLHKLEMTTRELSDYISRQYSLPYQKAQGMFEYSLSKRIDMYGESLRKSVGESNLIKTLTTKGVDAGWAIPSSMLDSVEHAGFVKLGDIDLTRFGLDPKVAKEWGGLHVHPTVSNQLQAYLELSTNPGKLAQYANVWSYVLKNFNIVTLAANGVPYLSRNVIGGMISYLAGGGNIARVIPGIHEFASVLGKGGLESLDDVHKIVTWPGTGEELTKREAFKRMFVKRGVDYVTNQADIKLGVSRSQTNSVQKIVKYGADILPINALPRAIGQQFEYAKYMGKGWGLGEAAGLGAKQLNDYIREVFAPIAYGNAVVDGGLKWAWMMTQLKSTDGKVVSKMDDFGTLMNGGKEYKSPLELFDDMDNYFINGYTQGTVQKKLAKYVVPFGQFAMGSTPMAIRHAIRNPNQFMAYNRLIRMNHRENMRDPDIREAGYSEFEMMAMPMTLFKDYKNKGQVLTLFPNNVDMYGSSMAYLAKQAQRVQRLTSEGGFVGQGPKDRKQLTDPYGLRDFIVDNMKDNQNPVFAMVSEFVSGKDSLGRDIDKNKRAELGGAAINPNTYWLLSKLPGFSQFNQTFGGRGAITSANGEVQSPAQPGLFGTPNREATRSEESKYRASQFMGSEAYGVVKNFLGLDVRTIDLAEGRQHTLKDVRYTIQELQKKSTQLKSAPQSPERDAQLELVANQTMQLKVDEHRVSKWLQSNNIADPNALKVLQKQGLTVRQLPVTPAKMNEYIQEYMNTTSSQGVKLAP